KSFRDSKAATCAALSPSTRVHCSRSFCSYIRKPRPWARRDSCSAPPMGTGVPPMSGRPSHLRAIFAPSPVTELRVPDASVFHFDQRFHRERQILATRRGDERLPVARDEGSEARAPSGVKLGEHVVDNEDRRQARALFKEARGGQFKRQRDR